MGGERGHKSNLYCWELAITISIKITLFNNICINFSAVPHQGISVLHHHVSAVALNGQTKVNQHYLSATPVREEVQVLPPAFLPLDPD